MGTTRYVLRRSSRAKLTHDQELELWLGVGHRGTTFESEEHCRAAWFHHRDRLMRWFAKDGRRPQAWWRFEAPQKGLYRYPGYEHERSSLYEFSDVLSTQERAELEAYWRREFERSWRPNFSFYAGGKIHSSDDARWGHWLFCDVPPPLL